MTMTLLHNAAALALLASASALSLSTPPGGHAKLVFVRHGQVRRIAHSPRTRGRKECNTEGHCATCFLYLSQPTISKCLTIR